MKVIVGLIYKYEIQAKSFFKTSSKTFDEKYQNKLNLISELNKLNLKTEYRDSINIAVMRT